MKRLVLIKIFLFSIASINYHIVCSQNFIKDSAEEASNIKYVINLYHQFLNPETGLYNGSQYSYNAYYPFKIDQGDPFFHSGEFVTGAVFYNNVLYEKVPLLYDLVKGELLIHDPGNINIIRLNNQSIKGFNIYGHNFIRLVVGELNHPAMQTGFYDLLYHGNIELLKKISKSIKENSASFAGLNTYVVETNDYFIKKDNQYFPIKNQRALLLLMNNKRKEMNIFIKKNDLNYKKDKEEMLVKTVSYYDEINNNSKTIN